MLTAASIPSDDPVPLFPCLRISNGNIFLFTEQTNGKCSPMIFSERAPDILTAGLYTSDDLTDPRIQEEYEPYYGTVTIESRRN